MSNPAPTFTPWWRPLTRSDRWALLWLLLIPTALFVVPALLGRPAIDADNLIQNFPLRVLAGKQIASGHLPLLDPLTNAGTPLLGGMNAGALYPLTVIFAFIPAIAAWVFNMIVVYLTAAVGVFALLRWHGLRTVPSFAAAISYAYSGAMIGQMVHLGVIQGFSFIPWAALVMLALSRRLSVVPTDAPWRHFARVSVPWIAGVAILWGLVFLTGEPRGIAELELLTIIIVPCVLLMRSSYWLTTWRVRLVYLSTLVIGFVWGIGLGLVQLLPGWSFISFSQRSQVDYRFFGAGSLPVHWATLLLNPDLVGGNGAFGQQGFFANYNLAEVTGYAGVLALMAGAAFVSRLHWRGWKGADRDFMIYAAIGVVGLFAAWGYFTPLGHLFRAIPLFGSTRLQSRNIILVDFAFSIMLGWWLEHLIVTKELRAKISRRSTWISVAPALVIAALCVALIGWGPFVLQHIGVPAGKEHFATTTKLLDEIHLVVALVGVLAIRVWRHARRLLSILMTVLVVDLLVFSAFTATGLIGGSGPREPSRASAVALFGTKGRFALVDQGGVHTGVYRSLGEPNLNVFTSLASVQGYGALISTIYDNATGTHPQTMLNPCALAKGTFSQLRLSAVAISGSELATSTSLATSVPTSCVTPRTPLVTHRYFGQILNVHTVTLTSTADASLSLRPIALQLLSAQGKPLGVPVVEQPSKKAAFTFTGNRVAAGFVVSSTSPLHIGDTVVSQFGTGPSYRLDTNFQMAIDSSTWKLTSTEDKFSVFKATTLRPKAYLAAPNSKSTVTNIRSASWGDTWVSVALNTSSVLDRSDEYLPGWRATAVNAATGQRVNLVVHRAGLIQSVRVPKGKWTIHFHYHAPYIEASVATSAVSWVLMIGVAVIFIVTRRRRGNDKVLA
ncbi:MAG TPA: hypothetical protein VII65_04005 [Acidimicrobiales bacterium]